MAMEARGVIPLLLRGLQRAACAPGQFAGGRAAEGPGAAWRGWGLRAASGAATGAGGGNGGGSQSREAAPLRHLSGHAKVLDGRAVAEQWKREVTVGVRELVRQGGRAPGLAVIQVGERVDSTLYVRRKEEACHDAGIAFALVHLSEGVSEEELLASVKTACAQDDVDGVLVQLPLPKHISEEKVMEALNPHKDVDGFHPLNMGHLVMRGAAPLFEPCTPKGCMELLERYGTELKGKHAVVLGDSNTVGLPMAMLLRNHGVYAVTLCHQADPRVPEIARTADLLVVAVGHAGIVRKDWVKKGAVVLDVGINAFPADQPPGGDSAGRAAMGGGALGDRASSAQHGLCMNHEYRVVGDVDGEVAEVAGALTPVPGGVGPMTIAALLHNTLLGAQRTLMK